MPFSPLGRLKEYTSMDNTSEDAFDPLLDSYNSKSQQYKHVLSKVRQWSFYMMIILTAAILGAFCEHNWGVYRNNALVQHVSQYGPILSSVPITFRVRSFNGTFLPEGNPFRGPAGLETDAAWLSMGTDYRAMILPENEATKSGLTADHVRISPKYGGGYPVNVEGLHHLHCLNLLRKSSHWNYDFYKKMGVGPFSNSDYVLESHVTHCLDVLRQQLMCQIDIAVFGQVWTQGRDGLEPFTDFHTDHKCRNFEDVRQWAEERQIEHEDGLPSDYFLPPSGHVYSGTP